MLLIKDTALLSVIGAQFGQRDSPRWPVTSGRTSGLTAGTATSLIQAALLYLIITIPLTPARGLAGAPAEEGDPMSATTRDRRPRLHKSFGSNEVSNGCRLFFSSTRVRVVCVIGPSVRQVHPAALRPTGSRSRRRARC